MLARLMDTMTPLVRLQDEVDLVDRRGRRTAPGRSRRGQAGVQAAAGHTGHVATGDEVDGSDPAPPATTGGRLV